jgi:hypothetical protein
LLAAVAALTNYFGVRELLEYPNKKTCSLKTGFNHCAFLNDALDQLSVTARIKEAKRAQQYYV